MHRQNGIRHVVRRPSSRPTLSWMHSLAVALLSDIPCHTRRTGRLLRDLLLAHYRVHLVAFFGVEAPETLVRAGPATCLVCVDFLQENET